MCFIVLRGEKKLQFSFLPLSLTLCLSLSFTHTHTGIHISAPAGKDWAVGRRVHTLHQFSPLAQGPFFLSLGSGPYPFPMEKPWMASDLRCPQIHPLVPLDGHWGLPLPREPPLGWVQHWCLLVFPTCPKTKQPLATSKTSANLWVGTGNQRGRNTTSSL